MCKLIKERCSTLTFVLFRFFTRIDRVLRRSLGVSETAPTDTTVKPAPPVDPILPEEMGDTPDLDLQVEEIPVCFTFFSRVRSLLIMCSLQEEKPVVAQHDEL